MGNDFTNGDHSFKNWFKIMWSNGYIQIFAAALLAFFLILFNLSGTQLWVLLLPILIMGVVGYKGFYQFWNDLKNGRSR